MQTYFYEMYATAVDGSIGVSADALSINANGYVDYSSKNPVFVDSVSLADVIDITQGITCSDQVSPVDLFNVNYTMGTIAETVSATDQFSVSYGMVQPESITLADSTVFAFGMNPVDSVVTSDTVANTYGKVLTDSTTPVASAYWWQEDYVAYDYFGGDYVANGTGTF